MRPVVLASSKLVALALELFLPGLVLGNQAPERRHRQHDAIIEVRVPEGRDALDPVEHRAQLLDDGLLRGDLLTRRRRGAAARVLHQARELPLLMGELRADHLVLELEEAVTGEAVGMEPHAIAAGGPAELPEDGRLPAALGVTLEVGLEEAVGE